MNKLDLSTVTTTNIALFTAGTIDFLAQGWQQGVAASIIMQIGSSYSAASVYVLYGCVLSVVGGNNVISAGVIFFNGEFFYAPGNTLIGTSGTIISNLLIAPYSDAIGGDPMTFTITGPANVHNIRTCNFVYGTTGTGTISGTNASDYLNLISANGKYNLGIDLNGSTIVMKNNYYFSFPSTTLSTGVISFLIDFSISSISDEIIIYASFSGTLTSINISNVSSVGVIEIDGITSGTIGSASSLTLKIKIIKGQTPSSSPIIFVEQSFI